jgi:hypothetical protein
MLVARFHAALAKLGVCSRKELRAYPVTSPNARSAVGIGLGIGRYVSGAACGM